MVNTRTRAVIAAAIAAVTLAAGVGALPPAAPAVELGDVQRIAYTITYETTGSPGTGTSKVTITAPDGTNTIYVCNTWQINQPVKSISKMKAFLLSRGLSQELVNQLAITYLYITCVSLALNGGSNVGLT